MAQEKRIHQKKTESNLIPMNGVFNLNPAVDKKMLNRVIEGAGKVGE